MGIAIFGLNGAGKSTLAHALAKELGYYEMDVEDYYFPEQRESRKKALENDGACNTDSTGELPYSNAKSKAEVQEALLKDIKEHPDFIIAGVNMNWCEEILSNIELAFWVKAPLEERLKRIRQREEKRFGARALPGGDMYEQQKEFRRVVAGREEKSLEECAAKLKCPVVVLDGTMPVEYNIEKIIAEGKDNDAKRVTPPNADGPTAYFVLDRNQKPTMKQQLYKWWYNMRKAWAAKRIKANTHTMDEVCEYIKAKHGFTEVESDAKEYKEEYEEIKRYIAAVEERKQAALQVPKELFDIELCMFKKQTGDNELHIFVEKRYPYIGGGASGNTRTVKQIDKILKDVYLYYGATSEDIESKSKRYEELLRTLAR